MDTLLKATASTAGALLSNSNFVIPQFQREYSWQLDQVGEFWDDLSRHVGGSSYFLGLIILTEEKGFKHVVDGQQRILTLSLLATAIAHKADKLKRNALADRITADFLESIDYESDETNPRVRLSDENDNLTFKDLLSNGNTVTTNSDPETVSSRMVKSYKFLYDKLTEDLRSDPFSRLGKWSEFLTNRLHFAVFIHPDAASAYQVFEVVNTRGKELTTADLLKSYVLSQTTPKSREERYIEWQSISHQFSSEGANTFVQFIRHAVTTRSGHVLPKDLFGFLAQRIKTGKTPPNTNELMELLKKYHPTYSQMIDPSLPGPSETTALKVFASLNSLNVIAVRPILLALSDLNDAQDSMKFILKLVVRRIIVGTLGTGNVERRFGEVAKNIYASGTSDSLYNDLKDLNPPKEDFVDRLSKRSLNKGVLAFIRRSIIESTITPESIATLHYISTRQNGEFESMNDDEGAYWFSTLGNSFLTETTRRPKDTILWSDFKQNMPEHAINGEITQKLQLIDRWDVNSIETIGSELAKRAGDIWYP
jgi:hypothetical protein